MKFDKNFSRIIAGEINLLVLPGFLTLRESKLVCNAFNTFPIKLKRYDPVTPPIEKVGWSFYEYSSRDFELYFEKAATKQAELERIFSMARITNPILKLLDQMIYSYDILPLSHSGQSASFGVLRKWSGSLNGLSGLIHEDYLECRQIYAGLIEDWGKSVGQLSVVVCFSNGPGGITQIYNKRPTVEDYCEQAVRLEYGFKPEFIDGVDYTEVFLNPGDLLVFDSTLLHSIGAVREGERITQQCFINILNDGSLRFWS